MSTSLHRFLTRSIRGRLMLVVTAVLLPAAMLASWLIVRAYANERDAVVRNLTESARGLSLLIDASLHEREALLRALATSRQLDADDLSGFHRQAASALHSPEEWIVLIEAGGQQLVNTSRAPDAPLPRYQVPDDLRAELERSGVYISNFTIGPASRRSLVYLTVPVVRENRPPRVLNIVMTTDSVSRTLLDRGLGTGWLIALIDREGTIIARNRDPERFVGTRASENMIRATTAGPEGVIESVTLDGVASLTAFNRSPHSGWTVVLAAPRGELLRRAQALALVAAIVSVLSGMAGIILAVWLGRAVVRAVQNLVAQTESLGKGSGVVESTGMDETDIVSRALVQASKTLRAREQELAGARDSAVAASRAKDDFLATLSHELRSPLNPILLDASEAAEDPELPAEVRATFRSIVQNVQLEARLIDDLLDLTRINRGKLSLALDTLDLHALLTEAITTERSEARRKDIDLRADLRAEASMVLGDAIRLRQVFWNLLSNAIKFTPSGGRVQVVTRSSSADITVEITDDGIGLTADELNRVFQSFAQGDHATPSGGSRFGGLGLGLAISRLLVERHGGRVEAVSRGRDLGATFSVVLPLAVVPAAIPGLSN